MKLGDYEVININKNYLLIKEMDNKRMIFEIIEIINKEGTYKIINANIGIAKVDLIEDEKFIFPKGRSKSKFKNVITVYNYFGLERIDCGYINLSCEEELYEELLDSYGFDIEYLSEGKFKNYYFDLKEDLLTKKNIVIEDKNYIKDYKGETFKSIGFFNEISKIINVKNINSIRWGHFKNEFVLLMDYNKKMIVINGLGYGKTMNNKLKGSLYILEKCGFKDKNLIIENSEYTLKK